MKYHFYQTFENGELYDRFLEAVKQADIPHRTQLLEAGSNNSIGLPENVSFSAITGYVVFSAPVTCFPALNAILEPLVMEYYPVTAGQAATMQPADLMSRFHKTYGVNKIEFYTIKQALTRKNMLPDQLEETALVEGFISSNLQKKMSLTPVWVLGVLSVLFLIIGFIPGPLTCILLAVYAYNRKYKKQELPDGRIISLYDDGSVKKAAILLPAAVVLFLISVAVLIIKFSEQ